MWRKNGGSVLAASLGLRHDAHQSTRDSDVSRMQCRKTTRPLVLLRFYKAREFLNDVAGLKLEIHIVKAQMIGRRHEKGN